MVVAAVAVGAFPRCLWKWFAAYHTGGRRSFLSVVSNVFMKEMLFSSFALLSYHVGHVFHDLSNDLSKDLLHAAHDD